MTLQVLEPLNRAPIARDDTAQLVGGDVVDINVLFNDDEPDGDPLTLSITAAPDPALGSAQVRPGGIIRFASAPGAVGTATIGYQIDDGELTSNAVLRVSILPCGQAPPDAPDVFLQTAYMQPIAVDLAIYARNGDDRRRRRRRCSPPPASSRRRPARTATSCSTTRWSTSAVSATPAPSPST